MGLLHRLLSLFLFEAQGCLAATVHLDYLTGLGSRDGLEVGSDVLIRRVGHQSGQDVGLEKVVVGILRLQHNVVSRHPLAGLDIVVHLVVQTALQLGTHAGQLLGV